MRAEAYLAAAFGLAKLFQHQSALGDSDRKALIALGGAPTAQGESAYQGLAGLHQYAMVVGRVDDHISQGTIALNLDILGENKPFLIPPWTNQDARAHWSPIKSLANGGKAASA